MLISLTTSFDLISIFSPSWSLFLRIFARGSDFLIFSSFFLWLIFYGVSFLCISCSWGSIFLCISTWRVSLLLISGGSIFLWLSGWCYILLGLGARCISILWFDGWYCILLRLSDWRWILLCFSTGCIDLLFIVWSNYWCILLRVIACRVRFLILLLFGLFALFEFFFQNLLGNLDLVINLFLFFILFVRTLDKQAIRGELESV